MTEIIRTPINGNWELMLPKHRADRAEWFTGWERERLDAEYASVTLDAELLDPIRPLVFYIGAEEGDLPNLHCNWGADVVLVEPNPKVWSNIRVCFEANHNVEHVKGSFIGFASNTNADPTKDLEGNYSFSDALIVGNDWPSSAYDPVISDHGFRQTAEETDATPQITIDKLTEFFGGPQMITMDIEGAELVALQGAEHTLTDYRPVVFVSVHEEFLKFWWDQTPQQVYDFMQGFDYDYEILATDHETHVKFTPR